MNTPDRVEPADRCLELDLPLDRPDRTLALPLLAV